MHEGQELVKRAADVVLASLLLVAAVPVVVLAALGSAVALRAWPFFVQDRVGRHGEVFRFVKIRTLPPATNAYADKYALSEVRIPAFTRALRALHLDELPQLLLVIRGRMSLVGPRPEMPGLHRELPPNFADVRSRVRPGCTGLWQVSTACDGLIGEAPEYDSFYIRHRTLRLDAWILLQTAAKVLRGGRATVELATLPGWAAGSAASAPTASRPAAPPPPAEVAIDLRSARVVGAAEHDLLTAVAAADRQHVEA